MFSRFCALAATLSFQRIFGRPINSEGWFSLIFHVYPWALAVYSFLLRFCFCEHVEFEVTTLRQLYGSRIYSRREELFFSPSCGWFFCFYDEVSSSVFHSTNSEAVASKHAVVDLNYFSYSTVLVSFEIIEKKSAFFFISIRALFANKIIIALYCFLPTLNLTVSRFEF